MITFDATGMCLNPRIQRTRRQAIEHGAMTKVAGIIVHQTGAATAQSSLASYIQGSANGAHFLIDRDGFIFQTASMLKQTWHVGKLKARCLLENRCTPIEIQSLKAFSPQLENQRESMKSTPNRYPSNQDSIGIELVGEALPRDSRIPDAKKIYQAVSDKQNASLKWLITKLTATLGVPLTEVFRHPDVSRKNPTEALTAKW